MYPRGVKALARELHHGSACAACQFTMGCICAAATQQTMNVPPDSHKLEYRLSLANVCALARAHHVRSVGCHCHMTMPSKTTNTYIRKRNRAVGAAHTWAMACMVRWRPSFSSLLVGSCFKPVSYVSSAFLIFLHEELKMPFATVALGEVRRKPYALVRILQARGYGRERAQFWSQASGQSDPGDIKSAPTTWTLCILAEAREHARRACCCSE